MKRDEKMFQELIEAIRSEDPAIVGCETEMIPETHEVVFRVEPQHVSVPLPLYVVESVEIPLLSKIIVSSVHSEKLNGT